ncbi:hypothetical protein C9374_005412 [Naegleria lovaniensis]|uniref:Cytochrome P450 n=1 Tax=Naegleria lovaniensis TaxID=51637 RepID=A0AA88GL39_NAELO|nr:uncharacterized protein C9374_005412 [Naegleria lovaniensis]KAG2382210.1 hypothetical protein C9374_005412 [Naegleria lovaniensis]
MFLILFSSFLILFITYHLYHYSLHRKEVNRVKHIPGYSFYSYFTLKLFAPEQDFLFLPRSQALNAAKFGKHNIWRITMGTDTICFVVNPEHYKDILVTKAKLFRKHPLFNNLNIDYRVKNVFTDYGDSWKRHRQLTQPSFSDDNLAKILKEHVHRISNRLVEKIWEGRNLENNCVVINDWMRRVTLDVISNAGFGAEFDCLGNEKDILPLIAKTIVQVLSAGLLFNRRYIEPFTKFFFPSKYKLVFKEWPSILRNMVDRREKEIELEKESGEIYKSNLISQMLLAKEEEPTDGVKKGFTKDEVVANSHAFMLAGDETSQQTLIWMFYFISRHENVQEKLREEVIREVPLEGIDFELYQNKEKLIYARNVLNETLRLKGPVHTNTRYTLKPVEIANKTIPKGVTVEMKFCVSQMDTEIWGEDALLFCPERFERPEIKDLLKQNRYTFIPFSIGPRTCIGMKFAEMEILDVVCRMVRNYDMKCQNQGEIKEVAGITLKPADDIVVKLEKRGV